MTNKMPVVRLPKNPDDTVTLAPLVDFREPNERYRLAVKTLTGGGVRPTLWARRRRLQRLGMGAK